MFLSKIEIQGFRNFPLQKDSDGIESGCIVEFVDGVNVIIGHNNSGKSNLLKALT